jgi:hypothetical protein
MTAKQAVKARCRDCSRRECGFDDCALKGLAEKEGRCDRTETIRKYCQWCMNGHPVNQCASPDCAIYQYRANVTTGNIKVSFYRGITPKNDHCGQRRPLPGEKGIQIPLSPGHPLETL